MSVLLDLLRCILCCEEDHRNYRDDETLIQNPYWESPSYSTFAGSSSPSYNNPVHRPNSETTNRVHNVPEVQKKPLLSKTKNEVPSSYYSPPSSSKPPPSPSKSSISSHSQSSSSIKPPPSSSKSILSPAPPVPTNQQAIFIKIDPNSTNRVNNQRVSQNLSPSSYYLPPSSSKPPPSPSKSSISSHGQSSSSIKPPPSSSKSILSPAPPVPTNQQAKKNYVLVQKGTLPIYVIPKDIEDLIKRDIVPEILKKPLSSSLYRDYFAALLYAEDFYFERWKDFELLKVTLKLHEAAIYKKSDKKKYFNASNEKDDKTFVAFEMDSVRERRPFLLSRDFVFVRPSGSKVEPFQGVIYRVVRSTLVLVEFGDDFHSQHYPTRKYDVSFSFNRFCLKRAHQAIEAASDPLFGNFLFPNSLSRNRLSNSPAFLSPNNKLDFEQTTAIRHILRLKSPPPYLLEGPLSTINGKHGKELSKTGLVVREAVLHLYLTSPKCRILVCAPTNATCDVLMSSLKTDIRESDMFRANAAFREVDGVPYEILPSCLYKDECFVCPSLQELRHFKVIFSTFVSSFRLHGVGITAGHFSHIFLLDASSTIEPEAMVVLANLANDETAVVVTGANGNRSGWVRSDIARQNGLRVSYFERLCDRKLYKSSDPMFITRLGNTRQDSDDTYSVRSFY